VLATCAQVTLSFDWLAFTVKLVWWAALALGPNTLLQVLANQMRAVPAKYKYADANQAELRARRVL